MAGCSRRPRPPASPASTRSWCRCSSTASSPGRTSGSSPSSSSALIAQILIIVGAAGAFAWLITTSGFPAKLIAAVDHLGLQTWVLLIVINCILLFVGSVLEPPAAILLLTPLLTPIVYQAGIDPIHFGIIVTVNLAIGMFMPPFGLNLFASHALFGTPLPKLYRGVLPFLVIYLIMLVLITYVPAITLTPLRLLR